MPEVLKWSWIVWFFLNLAVTFVAVSTSFLSADWAVGIWRLTLLLWIAWLVYVVSLVWGYHLRQKQLRRRRA